MEAAIVGVLVTFLGAVALLAHRQLALERECQRDVDDLRRRQRELEGRQRTTEADVAAAANVGGSAAVLAGAATATAQRAERASSAAVLAAAPRGKPT